MKKKNLNPTTIEQIYENFKGKGGHPESETILNDNNSDKKDGFVVLWSNKVDAAKIIERCKADIISFKMVGDGVQLQVARKAFRGVHCAFRKSKERKKRTPKAKA